MYIIYDRLQFCCFVRTFFFKKKRKEINGDCITWIRYCFTTNWVGRVYGCKLPAPPSPGNSTYKSIKTKTYFHQRKICITIVFSFSRVNKNSNDVPTSLLLIHTCPYFCTWRWYASIPGGINNGSRGTT